MKEADRLRKAAILIDTLDTTRADALLDQMPEAQRDRIRQVVMELEYVTDAEREEVIAEFLGPEAALRLRDQSHRQTQSREFGHNESARRDLESNPLENHSSAHGELGYRDLGDNEFTSGSTNGVDDDVIVEFSASADVEPVSPTADSSRFAPTAQPGVGFRPTDWKEAQSFVHSTPSAREHQTTAAARRADSVSRTHQPFAFLQGLDADAVAACLEYENPQAIAVVISQLPPDQAASVVSCFATRTQAEVVRRMSRLQDAEPAVLVELEDYLRQRMAQTVSLPAEDAHGPGVRALVRMLEVAGDAERKVFLQSLADDRPALARHLARQFGLPLEGPSTNHSSTPIGSAESPGLQPAGASPFAVRSPVNDAAWSATVPTSPANVSAEGPDVHNGVSVGWTASYPVSFDSSVEAVSPFASSSSDVVAAGDDAWMVTRPSVNHESLFRDASQPIAESDAAAESTDQHRSMTSNPKSATQAEEDKATSRHENDGDSPVADTRHVLDLAELDTRSLATLLQHAESDTLLIALAGAPPRVVDGLMSCLSRREARKVRSRIEKIGPIRIDDIEYAQRQLTDLANELIEEGVIKLRHRTANGERRRMAA